MAWVLSGEIQDNMVARGVGRAKGPQLSIRLTVERLLSAYLYLIFWERKDSLHDLEAPDISLLVPGESLFG